MSLPENEKTESAAQSALAEHVLANADKAIAADHIEQTMLNVELDEPEAWLEALRRVAARRARQLAHGLMSDEMTAKRWRNLANALKATQANLELTSPHT